NNTMLVAAITNYLLRGDGPFHMVMKGDDLWKRQCNLMLDRLKAIQ
ncbi:20824_t:CDS:1, partial [Gigaspora rosea]